MSIGLLFWLIMVIWLVLGIFRAWPGAPTDPRLDIGGSLLEFILFFLLGWGVFGFIVHN
jgi:hypothetical protein